jgi:hypothetical protein
LTIRGGENKENYIYIIPLSPHLKLLDLLKKLFEVGGFVTYGAKASENPQKNKKKLHLNYWYSFQ